MNKTSRTARAHEELEHAWSASNVRSTESVHGGSDHLLRRTIIALCAGHSPAEKDDQGTPQAMLGRVPLTSREQSWTGRIGELLVAPSALHSLGPSRTPSCCSRP